MTKTMMKLGDAGCSLLMGGALVETVILIYSIVNSALILNWATTGAYPTWYLIANVMALVLWALGLALASVGAFGLKQYGGQFPFAVGIIGIVTAAITTALSGISYVLPGLAVILAIVIFVLRGVFFILLGIAFVIVRSKTGYAGLSLATGILAIISGALFCSVFLASFPVAQILLMPTMICAAIVFWKEGGGGLI